MQSPLHFPHTTLKPELPSENRLKTQPTPPESGKGVWALIQEQLPREARKDVFVMYLSKQTLKHLRGNIDSVLKDLLLKVQISSSQATSEARHCLGILALLSG